jgi:hypothetical protein
VPGPTEETAVDFRRLSFDAPEETPSGQSKTRYFKYAPDRIRRLDGQNVRITGFMVPIRLEGRRVRECVIVASRLNCCFGQTPRFCEFVIARMKGDGVPVEIDVPVAFAGKLHVGDVYEGDYWSAFYVLDCSGTGH